jgi:AraC-like DNA-binding protein
MMSAMNDRPDAGRRSDWARVWRLGLLDGATLMHVRYSRQRFRPHSHEVFTIGAIFEGLFGIEVDGAYRKIAPGHFSFLAPRSLHTGECLSAELQYRTIYVSRAAIERLAGLRPDGDRTVWFHRPSPSEPVLLAEFVAAHEKLETAALGGGGETDLEAVLSELVRRYGRIGPRTADDRGRGRKSPAVRRALELVESAYRRDLGLDELADRAGVSAFHFIRLFKRETGFTPHSYLMQHRLERAKELLLSGFSIAQVAAMAGFYDQSHLGRHFRSLVGATPGEFVAARGLSDDARSQPGSRPFER